MRLLELESVVALLEWSGGGTSPARGGTRTVQSMAVSWSYAVEEVAEGVASRSGRRRLRRGGKDLLMTAGELTGDLRKEVARRRYQLMCASVVVAPVDLSTGGPHGGEALVWVDEGSRPLRGSRWRSSEASSATVCRRPSRLVRGER